MELLQDARATLFPIEWEEPFGLVMIESMACGTPVIATRWGAVPEVIDHGRSGIIVDHYTEMADALEAAENGAEVAGVVVDHVEVLRTLVAREDVAQLRERAAD